MVSMDSIPVQNPDVVGRVIGDEAVLVLPLKGQVKVLNEVGARIWLLIDGTRTVAEIIAVIFAEFTVNEADAKRDAMEFFTQLADREIIIFSKRTRAQRV
jgi:Coenzyme PQQ synthesis protein D (PqqD)